MQVLYTHIRVGNLQVYSLFWAPDLLILSSSGTGLQNSIDITFSFYKNLGLDINTKKTKVMIFNCGGKLNKDFVFLAGWSQIDISGNQTQAVRVHAISNR